MIHASFSQHICSYHLRSTTLHHLHNRAVQNVIVIVVDLERQSLRYSRSQSKRQLNRGNQQSYFFISSLHYLDVKLANNFATRVNRCTDDTQISDNTTWCQKRLTELGIGWRIRSNLFQASHRWED